MDDDARLERLRLSGGSSGELVQAWGLLTMACGGRPVEQSQDAVDRLRDYNYYNGNSYGRFHLIREERDQSVNIAGVTHSAWFDDGVVLNAIAIRPESRSQGLGARAIVTLAEIATKRGLSEMWLYAHPNSALQKFYRKLGFKALPDNDYRVDPATTSPCIPLVARVSRVAEVPLKHLLLSGDIL